MSKSKNDTLLQCPLPPREALRWAMMVAADGMEKGQEDFQAIEEKANR